MKRKKKWVFEGWIEDEDLFELRQQIMQSAIYKTKAGCKRELAGYENLRICKVKVTVEEV